jgi:hypothetical protein
VIFFKKRAYKKICKAIQKEDHHTLYKTLKSGFDPNYTIDNRSPHALFVAVEKKWLEGVDTLLVHGATLEDSNGNFNVISKVISLKWEAGLEKLISSKKSKKAAWFITSAVKDDWTEGVACFLKHGVSRDQLNKALHTSIFSQNKSTMLWLLEEGADPLARVYKDHLSYSDRYKCIPIEFMRVELSALEYAVAISYLKIIPDLLDNCEKMFPQGELITKFQEFILFAIKHGSVIAATYAFKAFDNDQLNNKVLQTVYLSVLELIASIKSQISSSDNKQEALLLLRRMRYVLNRVLEESGELFAEETGHQPFANIKAIRYEIKDVPIVTSSIFMADGSLRPYQGPQLQKYESSTSIANCINEIEAFIRHFEEALLNFGLVAKH